MAWIARDENKILHLFKDKPYRNKKYNMWLIKEYDTVKHILPDTDQVIFGISITWEDEPVEIGIKGGN